MFQRILVPLDGSRFAEAAVPAAAQIARRADSALRLILVNEPQLVPMAAPGTELLMASVDPEVREDREAYLGALVAKLGSVSGPGVSTSVVDGTVNYMLEKEIALWLPDLIVMTSHGRGGLSRFWLGSVADTTIRKVSSPVLLIKSTDNGPEAPPEFTLNTVLVPLDFSVASEAIFAPLKDLARLFDPVITLVHVLTPHVSASPVDYLFPQPDPHGGAPEQEVAERRLDERVQMLRREGLRAKAETVADPRPGRAILDLIEAGGYDLVALATHGKGGFRRAVLGSVADKVVRGSAKPVLVIRPEAQ